MFDQIGQNKRRTAVLIGLFVLLTAAVLAAAMYPLRLGPLGVVLAVLLAGGVALLSYWTSDRVALAVSGARPASRAEYPRLHNLVEGLCISGGMPVPRLFVIDEAAPNAFATGRDPEHAAIAFTSGLLAVLDRAELEGVVAHELSHIRNYDILVSTLAVTMVGTISIVSDLWTRVGTSGGSRSHSPDRDGDGPGGWLALAGLALLLVAPVLAVLMRCAVSRNRETLADVSAAELTRYPPGLISALEKLRDGGMAVRRCNSATAHLWFGAPDGGAEAGRVRSWWARRHDTHPPIEERIALLRAL
jgi:heat shock protein HtpX